MGTDENTTESARFARVRRRLSAPTIGGEDTTSVRERLPSLGTGDRTVAVRERLPNPSLDGGIVEADVHERLPRPNIQVPRPDVEGRLPDTQVRERLPDARLNGRLPTPQVDSLSVRSRTVDTPSVSLPDREALGPPASVEQRLRDSQTTTPEYFVGVVPESHEEVHERLADSPFGRSYVTYPKVLTDEEQNVEREADSIWVYRSWSLAHFQLHVVLFELPEEEAVYVFYHHEYNWLRHPVEHLDAEYLNPEFDRERIVELFESAGLSVRTCPDLGDGYPVAHAYCEGTGGETA